MTIYSDDGRESIVWVYDLNGATPRRRLTFGGRNLRPLWTPDSQRIEFTSDRDGQPGIFWQPADGSGTAERLAVLDAGVTPQSESWTPDGKTLIFSRRFAGSSTGLFTLVTGPNEKPKPLIPAPAANASLSRDGRWLAYNSPESGRMEVYVQPYPPTGAKYQVTTTGGTTPLWSPDGKQLFYLANDSRQLIAVDVQTQTTFVPGKSTSLPIQGIVNPGPRPYDVTPDGKYFVVMYPKSQTDSKGSAPEQINVSLNWFEELKQRVPVH